jgi:hypothetical protein
LPAAQKILPSKSVYPGYLRFQVKRCRPLSREGPRAEGRGILLFFLLLPGGGGEALDHSAGSIQELESDLVCVVGQVVEDVHTPSDSPGRIHRIEEVCL